MGVARPGNAFGVGRALYATFGVDFIPEGWERVAPGRAKRAPGEWVMKMRCTPAGVRRFGGGFNPSGVGFIFDALSPGRFAPGATGWNASGGGACEARTRGYRLERLRRRVVRSAHPGNGAMSHQAYTGAGADLFEEALADFGDEGFDVGLGGDLAILEAQIHARE